MVERLATRFRTNLLLTSQQPKRIKFRGTERRRGNTVNERASAFRRRMRDASSWIGQFSFACSSSSSSGSRSTTRSSPNYKASSSSRESVPTSPATNAITFLARQFFSS